MKAAAQSLVFIALTMKGYQNKLEKMFEFKTKSVNEHGQKVRDTFKIRILKILKNFLHFC